MDFTILGRDQKFASEMTSVIAAFPGRNLRWTGTFEQRFPGIQRHSKGRVWVLGCAQGMKVQISPRDAYGGVVMLAAWHSPHLDQKLRRFSVAVIVGELHNRRRWAAQYFRGKRWIVFATYVAVPERPSLQVCSSLNFFILWVVELSEQRPQIHSIDYLSCASSDQQQFPVFAICPARAG